MERVSKNYNFNNKEWFQPMEESPSVWTMFCQLIQSTWRALWQGNSRKHSFENLKPNKLLTPLFRYSDFPLIKERTTHQNYTHPKWESPYVFEEALDAPTAPINESVLKETLTELEAPACTCSPIQALVEPKSLDSIEDINTWIALHIDATASEAEDEQVLETSNPVIENECITIEIPAQPESLTRRSSSRENVRQTQDSINDLVNQYFSSKDASL